MRMIGSLDNAKEAQRFSAFLLTEGVNNRVDEEGAVWEVWVNDEDQLEKGKTLLADFKANPSDDKYQKALSAAEAIQREKLRKAREHQKRVNIGPPRPMNSGRSTPLTIILIALSGLVALTTNFGEERLSATMRALAYTSLEKESIAELSKELGKDFSVDDQRLRHASILRGEFWRTVTPIFIHHGGLHLVFNMIWLFQLGRLIEQRYGSFYLVLLVLVVAAISNYAQCTVPVQVGGSVPRPYGLENLLTGMGGMSGVIFGLFGFIWVKSSIDSKSRLFMPQSTIMFVLGYMFLCMTPLAAQIGLGNVANWAHGIGLLVGMLAGYLMTSIGK